MLVSTTSETLFERILAFLPPGWQRVDRATARKHFAVVGDDDDSGLYDLHRGDAVFTTGLEGDLALLLLESQMRTYIALHARERIFVHAGAVGHRGRAIVIPGFSFSGKTTLVAALVRAGATYLSDEFAPLDESGLVHPYAKPLSVRDEGLVQHDQDVASIGGTSGTEPLPIGLIVATSYEPGAQWRPRRLSNGEGVLALLAHTVAAQTRPAEVMRFLRQAVDGIAAIESARDDAAALAPLLLEELDRRDRSGQARKSPVHGAGGEPR